MNGPRDLALAAVEKFRHTIFALCVVSQESWDLFAEESGAYVTQFAARAARLRSRLDTTHTLPEVEELARDLRAYFSDVMTAFTVMLEFSERILETRETSQ
jgi:hypothetical protein